MLHGDGEKHWYALKIFYNRVFEVEKFLMQQNVQTYIPLRRVESDDTDRRKRQPAVSSLLFLYQTEQYILELQARMKTLYPLMAYFDRATKKPAAIPDREMNVFMLVTSADDSGLEYFESDESYRSGDRVRVTGGVFKGAEGYIKRVRGNRRLVVTIEGVVAVATAYIPGCFLERESADKVSASSPDTIS